MKLIYQQMLAFFAVIMTTLVIVGFSFVQLTSHMVYENTWTQLEGYAKSMMNQAITINTNSTNYQVLSKEFLENSEAILSQQQVNFAVFDANNNLTYPESSQNYKISPADWKKLEKNNIVHRKISQSGKIYSNSAEMTDVMVPWFYNGKLSQVILVGSSVSNIEANVGKIEHNLFSALLISSVAAIILSYFLAKYQVKKISRLRIAAHQVTKGDFDLFIPTKGKDEIDDLSEDFNAMVKSLKASQEEIKRQEDRRRQFMADAAHEMRTPLTTINGLLEGLEYNAIPEEMKGKSIELMQTETKRLIRLVNENLDYEKIRTNQISLSRYEFNARPVLENIIQQIEKKASDAEDELVLEAPKEIKVYADYDRFVQIMFNIIQNAVQFTQHGKITITGSRDYQEAVFKISDTGIGMTEDEVQNIWERYYKADPSRKNTKYGESGLGLAIVHQLVQLHGGTIEVTSEKNRGTTFTLRFPDEEQGNSMASQPVEKK